MPLGEAAAGLRFHELNLAAGDRAGSKIEGTAAAAAIGQMGAAVGNAAGDRCGSWQWRRGPDHRGGGVGTGVGAEKGSAKADSNGSARGSGAGAGLERSWSDFASGAGAGNGTGKGGLPGSPFRVELWRRQQWGQRSERGQRRISGFRCSAFQ